MSDIVQRLRGYGGNGNPLAEEAADEIERLRGKIEIFRQAKLEIDELEGVIDLQTYDQHRKAEFDMPDDAELHLVLTVKDERRLSRALSAMTQALMLEQARKE